jgi:DNA polymerase III epsilon subunit-like protein
MLVVDVETTGLNPQRNAMVSIGAIDFRRPERRFFGECRVWEGAQIDAQALVVNGYTHEQLMDPAKQSLEELMKAFVAWVRESDDQMLAGQAPTFDHGFLRASANKCGIDWFPGYRMIDLQTVAYVHYLKRGIQPPLNSKGTPGLSLDVTAKYVGLPEEPRPHLAQNGAAWETESFARLIYGKNLLPEFSQYALPDYLSQNIA